MGNKKVEILVGIFILAILFILGWLTTQMGKLSLTKKPVYHVYAIFNDVSGLDINTKVDVAGVNVGYVKSIGLKDGRAIVELSIYRKYRIPVNSIAIIKNRSLLGEKYLEIKYGSAHTYLKNNQFITRTFSPTDLGTLITNINKIFNQQNRQHISKTLAQISKLSEKLNEVVQENRKNIKKALSNFNKAMQTLAQILKENKQDVRVAMENAKDAMQKLNETLQNIYFLSSNLKQGKGTLGKLLVNSSLYNNVNNASAHLKNIFAKIDTGKGTIGKLVNNNSVYNNLNSTLRSIRTYLTKGNQISLHTYAATQYNFRNSYSKGIFNVDIYTMPDKFYRIGIVNERNYKHTDSPSNQDTVTRFTALMGKRYYNFVLRAGIMESTFGIGADYYMMNDNLKASIDAFDFNHENDIRDKHAHIKLQLTYRLLRHFDIFGGVDELLNSRTRSAFLGGGIEFSSNDIKYLLTKAPSISPK